jgi:hypothetical protein
VWGIGGRRPRVERFLVPLNLLSLSRRAWRSASVNAATVPLRTVSPSCGRAEAVVVERAADALHRARMHAKAFGYLAHALGAPGRP